MSDSPRSWDDAAVEYRWSAVTTVTPAISPSMRTAARPRAPEAEAAGYPDDHVGPGSVRSVSRTTTRRTLSIERTLVHDLKLGGVRIGQLALGVPPVRRASTRSRRRRPRAGRRRACAPVEESQRPRHGRPHGAHQPPGVRDGAEGETSAPRGRARRTTLFSPIRSLRVINDTHGHGAGDPSVAVADAPARESRVYDRRPLGRRGVHHRVARDGRGARGHRRRAPSAKRSRAPAGPNNPGR